jgi:DNA replicative helicase MCM subunit Mcm2 (Cdc46/Mcm family)
MDGTPFELDFTEEDARTAIKLLEQGLTQIMWEDNRKSERLNRAVMGIDI